MTDEELNRRFDLMMHRINDNHETVLTQLREMRAEMVSTRSYVGARVSETEMIMMKLFNALSTRLDQTERSVEERLRRLEGE